MTRHLTIRHDVFALSRPFRIARGSRTEAEVVTVIIAQGDVVGRGECTPYPRYGESIASTIAAIEGCRALVEAGGNRAALATALSAGAARNAVDCALWDLEAKLADTSVGDTDLAMSNVDERVEKAVPGEVRYIKLGSGGAWEATCLDGGRIDWGVPANLHDAARAAD